MKRLSHLLPFVLLMLTSACVLSACASQPQVPVIAHCPQFPEPPPSLMQPPQAPKALSELEAILQTWVDGASSTP